MLLYAATIFLSAFLLFEVQPLIAKIILPWFGGSAAVWSAAMLFFQLVLLAGYTYAHLSIRYLKPRAQILTHSALLLASGALLPILPSESWKPSEAGDPTLRILLLLTATIGLPYFLLSSTSPLLQAWYVRTSGSGMPYRLFALSNFGSMLALLSFPFLIEPHLTSRHQAYYWSGAYIAFALLCARSAWSSEREAPAQPLADQPGTKPRVMDLILWITLSTIGSVLLFSITTHLSQNVAPIPFLWVLPLALYLATFMLAFESDKIYNRGVMFVLLVPMLYYMAHELDQDAGNLHIKYLIPLFSAGLFLCCMLCHGELARRRPAPRYLTLFYLMVSVGGALGGVFVTLLAPRVFSSHLELPLSIGATAVVAAIVMGESVFNRPRLWLRILFIVVAFCAVGAALFIPIDTNPQLQVHWKPGLLVAAGSIAAALALYYGTANTIVHWAVRVALVLAVGFYLGFLGQQERVKERDYRLIARNFYGVLHIRDDLSTTEEEYSQRTLYNGTINHGSQILDQALRYKTTSYYGEYSGIGRAIRALQKRGPVRVGVVGLGAGVLSNYGRQGDFYRIFEINPLVEKIAQTEFTFYPHSPADKRILMGDARLTMERIPNLQLDVLAVDAFSSDAIPIHLLTREALTVYFHHLKADGVLALHISNRYLDLEPVCAAGAALFNKPAMTAYDEGDEAPYLSSSSWVLVTSDSSIFLDHAFDDAVLTPAKPKPGFRAWTDDYSNVFQILKLN